MLLALHRLIRAFAQPELCAPRAVLSIQVERWDKTKDHLMIAVSNNFLVALGEQGKNVGKSTLAEWVRKWDEERAVAQTLPDQLVSAIANGQSLAAVEKSLSHGHESGPVRQLQKGTRTSNQTVMSRRLQPLSYGPQSARGSAAAQRDPFQVNADPAHRLGRIRAAVFINFVLRCW
jgi:hypothetical protein